MREGYCRGCGSVLQSSDPGKPGYLPVGIEGRNKQLICQRCYKMTHYGSAGATQPTLAQIQASLRKAVDLSQLLLIVADFADLAGTLPVWKEYIGEKPYIIAVNKSDLLSRRTPAEEITAYLTRYLKTNAWRAPQRIIMTSGLKGKNINSLASSLRAASSPGMKIAVLGTTNVGKSSLVKQIIQLEGGHQAPTVSKFPGTTVGLSNWAILKGRNTLIDTPGLTPGHRLTDLFCVNCVSNLFTTTKLEQKLWGIKPGKSLVLGGYAALTWLGAEETVLIAFAPTAVHLHRTDQEKVDSLLTEKPQWLHQLCKTCQAKLEWEEHRIQLAEDQDIAIAGLGWISVRRQGGEFRLHIPKGIRWEIRPALVGKRVKE